MGKMLTLNNVSLDIEGKRILNDIDLFVNEGEIYTLLGTNGAGKSTLAHLIMGTDNLKPSIGTIEFKKNIINKFSISERARLGITLLWQEPARFEGITVKDYLLISSRQNPNADIEKCLLAFGLKPKSYLKRYVDKSLSGGERKRIELASIMAMGPKLAILDEPDSGIDFASIKMVTKAIANMNKAGTTILLITHREYMLLASNRASIMDRGRLIETGKPDRIGKIFKSMYEGKHERV